MPEHDGTYVAVVLVAFVVAIAICVALAAFFMLIWNDSGFSLFEKTLLTVLVIGFTADVFVR